MFRGVVWLLCWYSCGRYMDDEDDSDEDEDDGVFVVCEGERVKG